VLILTVLLQEGSALGFPLLTVNPVLLIWRILGRLVVNSNLVKPPRDLVPGSDHFGEEKGLPKLAILRL